MYRVLEPVHHRHRYRRSLGPPVVAAADAPFVPPTASPAAALPPRPLPTWTPSRGVNPDVSPACERFGTGCGCRVGQVVGPGFLTIAVMDIAAELLGRSQRIARDPLPASWCEEPALGDVRSFGELVRRLRRLDAGSDEALRALARLAEAGETEACLVVTAALLPLLIARCDRQPRLVAEALPELASRVTDPATEEPKPGVANRLLRRVVWRVHHDYGQRKVDGAQPEPAVG